MQKNKSGFTLIELVVVMAIIAVLSLLIVAAIQAARRASIETQRKGNVKTVETALEARYSKCGAYIGGSPAGACGTLLSDPANISSLITSLSSENFITASQINIDDPNGYGDPALTGSTFTLTALDNGGNVIYTAQR